MCLPTTPTTPTHMPWKAQQPLVTITKTQQFQISISLSGIQKPGEPANACRPEGNREFLLSRGLFPGWRTSKASLELWQVGHHEEFAYPPCVPIIQPRSNCFGLSSCQKPGQQKLMGVRVDLLTAEGRGEKTFCLKWPCEVQTLLQVWQTTKEIQREVVREPFAVSSSRAAPIREPHLRALPPGVSTHSYNRFASLQLSSLETWKEEEGTNILTWLIFLPSVYHKRWGNRRTDGDGGVL